MSRRRQPNATGGRRKLCEVWATPEQAAAILLAAGKEGVTVARFLAEAGVAMARSEDAGTVQTPTARRRMVEELFALRHTIAEAALGAKRVEVNINQIARGVHVGQPVPVEEMRAHLRQAQEFRARARELAENIDALIDELRDQGIAA